jgi:hypothetical protein
MCALSNFSKLYPLPVNRLNLAQKMVRSPGFEPGSSTWQADVLNQARLRPLFHAFGWFREPWRLFKFSEKANPIRFHDILKPCLNQLLRLMSVSRFFADVSIVSTVGFAELRIQKHVPQRLVTEQ